MGALLSPTLVPLILSMFACSAVAVLAMAGALELRGHDVGTLGRRAEIIAGVIAVGLAGFAIAGSPAVTGVLVGGAAGAALIGGGTGLALSAVDRSLRRELTRDTGRRELS